LLIIPQRIGATTVISRGVRTSAASGRWTARQTMFPWRDLGGSSVVESLHSIPRTLGLILNMAKKKPKKCFCSKKRKFTLVKYLWVLN
jgi:hypothetical protein